MVGEGHQGDATISNDVHRPAATEDGVDMRGGGTSAGSVPQGACMSGIALKHPVTDRSGEGRGGKRFFVLELVS